jgi:hypothetical protein
MLVMAVDFANLLLASLVVGVMLGVWLTFNPTGLDPTFYVTQWQQGIRALNIFMPLLGIATILLTIAAAVLARDWDRLLLLLAVVFCFLAAAIVTRFLNQPINAIVMTWSANSPPADWSLLWDKWWRWHVLRLMAGLVGLCLLIAATLKHAVSG